MRRYRNGVDPFFGGDHGSRQPFDAVKTECSTVAAEDIRELHEYIQKNFDNVGDKFAEVALRIHHGEEDGRNIRGTTTGSEEETLREEGVQFIKISLPKYDG